MKKLLNIIACLSIWLLPNFATAQDQEALEITPTDQPYPAGNQPLNETTAAFISVFDDTNVGNLHVFAPMKAQPATDYFFYGTDITGSFDKMLPRRTKRILRRKNAKLYATRNIRGVNGEYYILRTVDKKGNPTLDLYELAGKKLSKIKTLAQTNCKNTASCNSLDSWIQDVNGDTRLDIIQKEKVGMKTNVVVYTQNARGKFVQNDDVEVDSGKYIMEYTK